MLSVPNKILPYVSNCMLPCVSTVEFHVSYSHSLWFSCLGIALIIWLSMGYGTRGEEGKLLVAEVEGVVCRLQGWVGGLGSEVSKGEGKV
jgi:hypothetical protein